MSLETIRRVLAGSAAIMLVCGFGAVASAGDNDFFIEGVKRVSLSTDWTRGGGSPHWCAAMANQHYPGKPFQLLGASEEFKWDEPIFHIGPNYKYHCDMLVRVS
jgi:hypothetical protein